MTSGAETQLLSVDERVAGEGGLTSSPEPWSVVGVVKVSLLGLVLFPLRMGL